MTTARALRTAVAVVLLGSVLALVGCGIPADSSPRDIGLDKLPSALKEAPTSTPQSTTTRKVNLYFVQDTNGNADGGEILVPVATSVETDAQGAISPQTLVETLIGTRQPSPSTVPQLSNKLPADTTVLSATVDQDGILHLDLSSLGNLQGTPLYLAVAQIVFTVTERPDISGVVFSIDGTEQAVPYENGTQDAGKPVDRSYYPTFKEKLQPSVTTP